LIDGILVEKPLGQLESRLAVILISLIQHFVQSRKLGVVYGPDCPIRLLPNQVRQPDVSFFGKNHFPDGKLPTGQVLEMAPDFAIEGISPSNTPAEMDHKVTEYFQAGVSLLWYVYPITQTVRVFHSPVEFQDLKEDMLLHGAAILPGFEVTVRALFDLAMKI